MYILEKENIEIQKAYLVSCTNSRASDIKEAAKVMKGKKVAKNVEFYVAAASSEVQKDAELSGDWNILLEAGAIQLPAGCGPCIGLGTGLLKDHEVGISATNRNYKGRMGSPLASVYLASPAVVASSAVSGRIISPASIGNENAGLPVGTYEILPQKTSSEESVEASGNAVPGFPTTMVGEIIFCDSNNLNTDGIYPYSTFLF